jgi:thioredoxin 2
VAFQNLSVCPSCRKSNRVPAKHLADTGRCGSCKAGLAPVSQPIAVDSNSLLPIIQEAAVPILVDFWAPWCGPCLAAAPEVEAVAREMAGRALVLKVDTQEHPELAELYQIQSIPQFLVFRGGKQFSQNIGAADRWEMRLWLERAGARME